MKNFKKTIAALLCILTVFSLCSCSLAFNEKTLKGSWTTTVDYIEMCEADGDKSYVDVLKEVFTEKGMDMSGFSYDGNCEFTVTYEFDGNGNYTATVDKSGVKNYLNNCLDKMIDHMLTREGLAVMLDISVEEFDETVEKSGMSFDEFVAQVREELTKEMDNVADIDSAVDEIDFGDFEGEGNYEIKGLYVHLDGKEESSMSYSDDKLNSIYKGKEKELEISYTKK